MVMLDKQQQQRRLLRMFLLWVGLPTLLAAIYYGLIASDLFESESRYTIHSSEMQLSSGLDALLSSGIGVGSGSDRDALAVQAFILSRDVLGRLDHDLGFIAHYQSDQLDWLSRLAPDATFEDAYDYYGDIVDVFYDGASGVSTLTVKATAAKDAQRFAQAILGYAEEMVNGLSERARQDRIRFARQEVEMGERRLAKARLAILELQLQTADLNPEASATAIMGVRGELEAELAKAQTELRELQAFMREGAHPVAALKERITSLEAQVAEETRKLVDARPQSLSSSIARFEPLVLEKEFAQKAYESALASLELARAEAAQQHRYLATVATPSQPDEAAYPERGRNIFIVFLLALLGLGIGSLVLAAVREHANL